LSTDFSSIALFLRYLRSTLFPYTTLFRSFSIVVIVFVFGFYFYNFNNGLSSDSREWGIFGDYVGGTISALLAPISLIVVGASNADRKSTRLNSSHDSISYAVLCLKKKKLN